MTLGLFGLAAEVHGAETQRTHTQAGATQQSILHAENRTPCGGLRTAEMPSCVRRAALSGSTTSTERTGGLGYRVLN